MPKLTGNVTWQEIDGELVVLDLTRSVYLTTNRSGAVLATLLQEERERDELVDALVAEYGVDRALAGRDVDAFLAQLDDKGLLV